MTALVWFSYPPDFDKLALSIQRCRKLDQTARLVVVLESHHAEPTIDGLEIVRRDFDRGFHLNGINAVHGVAQALAGIDADLVVKIDSDMMPNRAFWLEGPTVFQRFNNFYVGLYALPRHILKIVCRCLEDQPNPGTHEAIAIAGRAVTASHARGEKINHIRLPQGQFTPQVLTT